MKKHERPFSLFSLVEYSMKVRIEDLELENSFPRSHVHGRDLTSRRG